MAAVSRWERGEVEIPRTAAYALGELFAHPKLTRQRLEAFAQPDHGAPGDAEGAMLLAMQVIKTTVRKGPIVIDEPTTLPDGHEVELCVLNDDGMSEDERLRLHASIAHGIRDGRAGREVDFDSFMDQLDAEP